MCEQEYVSRPIGVTAIQLRRDNLKAVEKFLAGRPMPELYTREKGWSINWGNSHVKVQTIDGKRTATPGMWIVKGVLGRLSVYRDDVFREMFQELA